MVRLVLLAALGASPSPAPPRLVLEEMHAALRAGLTGVLAAEGFTIVDATPGGAKDASARITGSLTEIPEGGRERPRIEVRLQAASPTGEPLAQVSKDARAHRGATLAQAREVVAEAAARQLAQRLKEALRDKAGRAHVAVNVRGARGRAELEALARALGGLKGLKVSRPREFGDLGAVDVEGLPALDLAAQIDGLAVAGRRLKVTAAEDRVVDVELVAGGR